jgi:hypothetical protein
MGLRKTGCEDWKWMELAQDNWLSLQGAESLGSGTMVLICVKFLWNNLYTLMITPRMRRIQG